MMLLMMMVTVMMITIIMMVMGAHVGLDTSSCFSLLAHGVADGVDDDAEDGSALLSLEICLVH